MMVNTIAHHNLVFWKKKTKTRQAAESGIEYGLKKGQSLVEKYLKTGDDAIKFRVWHCGTVFGAKSKCVEGFCRQFTFQHDTRAANA